MTNTITKARIYEAQGLMQDALQIYKEILKTDPQNIEAIEGIKRLGALPREAANMQMKELFVTMQTPEQRAKFKEWLVDL